MTNMAPIAPFDALPICPLPHISATKSRHARSDV